MREKNERQVQVSCDRELRGPAAILRLACSSRCALAFDVSRQSRARDGSQRRQAVMKRAAVLCYSVEVASGERWQSEANVAKPDSAQ